MTRLSCHRFRSNEVRLWLSVIAYNLGNLWRRLVLPKRIEKWSLTSLQQRLVKTGGRLVKYARAVGVSGEPKHAACALRGDTERRKADRQLHSVPVRYMLRSVVRVENGNSDSTRYR